MEKKNRVVQPKPNWHDLQRMEELKIQRQEAEKNKKRIKLFQKVGLFAGLLGVAYSLGFSPVTAKEFQSRKGQISADSLPDSDKLKKDFDKAWANVYESVKETGSYAGNQAVEVVNKITPVISENIADLLPTIGPNVNNYPLKIETPVASPSLTRKLSQEELDQSDRRFAAQLKSEEEISLDEKIGPTYVVESKGTITPTPIAQVDLNPNFEGTLESSITFNSPFEYREANRQMSILGLDLADLFYVDKEKIKNFDALYSESDVLPIFPEKVMKWAPTVTKLCNQHNEINKDNPNRQINPNFILAIMSIESQGIQGAESHMAAKGLMQITTPIAKTYGYNEKSIYKPENNINTSIAFFADLKDMAVKLGLEKNDVYEYAAMFYNGGWNADKYFMTTRVEKILKSQSVANKVFAANDLEGVKDALLAIRGNIYAEGSEYFTFGTRLTKIETLKYREKIVRFVVIAELADEIRDGLIKKGLSKAKADELTKKFIKTSDFIKSVNKRIRSEEGPQNYFEEKEAFENFLKKRFNISELPEYTDSSSDNPAYYLMYR
jgi:hypothetical protein